jgi:hypothetical protein
VAEVVTFRPLLSVPVQVVVALLCVGSGVHCAKAGPATITASRIALVSRARAFTCRTRGIAFIMSETPN